MQHEAKQFLQDVIECKLFHNMLVSMELVVFAPDRIIFDECMISKCNVLSWSRA